MIQTSIFLIYLAKEQLYAAYRVKKEREMTCLFKENSPLIFCCKTKYFKRRHINFIQHLKSLSIRINLNNFLLKIIATEVIF